VSLVRKPDARKSHIRFDERDLETEETVRYSDTDKPKGSETVTAEPNSTAPDLDSTRHPFSAESPPSPVPGKVSACGSLMIYTIFKDQSGEYRWRLCARNYIVIAISGEGYKNHKDCSDSIDLVKESSSAPVIDATNKGSSERPRIAAENLGIVGERRAGIARVLKILRQCLRLGRRIFIGVASRLHPRAPQL
jgi:uncharacterized protein YegP (UPF0339 family)